MTTRILIDMDGVVSDFTGGACKVHGRQNPYLDHKGPRGDEAWHTERLLNIEEDVFFSPMDYDFWKNLEPTTDGARIVWAAETMFGRENLCFLSSPCPTLGCGDGKRDWVMSHYPGIPLLLSVSVEGAVSSPPKHFLAGPDTILVDDSTKNCAEFVKYGGRAILVPRPWNKKYGLMHFASDYVATQLGVYGAHIRRE